MPVESSTERRTRVDAEMAELWAILAELRQSREHRRSSDMLAGGTWGNGNLTRSRLRAALTLIQGGRDDAR
jgi:hypothetical protein